LIFAPHPDDETIACAGVILKARQDTKAVKVIFLTNGDASPKNCSAWSRKKTEELLPEDFISLGKERQQESLRAAGVLGLADTDVIFLSYPDKGLLELWDIKYKNNPAASPDYREALCKSETTQKFSSPYPLTYNRSKSGYSRKNLLMDIKDILQHYSPKVIYIPHPADAHSDHVATAYFVNLALEELQIEDSHRNKPVQVAYYLCHAQSNNSSVWPYPNDPVFKAPVGFSQKPTTDTDITVLKDKKAEALKAYQSQLIVESEKKHLESFVKNNELFWDVAVDKKAYLVQLQEEWQSIAKIMRQEGFNVNLAPAVDVAGDIEDTGLYLAKRRRMYSQNPEIVSELALAQIKGMARGGIVPVIKHFPGLGSVRADTHTQLPAVEISRETLYGKDMVPFKNLIKEENNIWVMVDHALYPCLSNQPASLSYEIQTKLLREELGFKGIIIADELLNMQSIFEYAWRQKIKEPYIGEIIVRAFEAGIDIALMYPPAEKSKEIVSQILQKVTQAVAQGRLKEKDIDASVERILREKELIFGRPLTQLLHKMTLEEKICQKLAIDIYNDIGVLKKYPLGSINPNYRATIAEAQANAQIPLFIFAQHEGGAVKERLLNISTRSAYVVGKEFERVAGMQQRGFLQPFLKNTQSKDVKVVEFNTIGKKAQNKIISFLIEPLDRLIELYLESKETHYIPAPNPSYLSPLTITTDGSFELKPFFEVPAIWLRKFDTEEYALCAYRVFEKIFGAWKTRQKSFIADTDSILLNLASLKKRIEEFSGKSEEKSGFRVLCLAAHPDDEDAELLAYFGKRFKCHTYVLLATRGEGGENEIGPALYDELGALRTEEMAKSASILGVRRVYYLGKNDFGYSQSSEEVFKFWDKDDTLRRLVYFIRLIRPHIIITRHNPQECGQHQALAMLSEQAFDLAGDPNSYPEMLTEGLMPWAPIKFYQRSWGAQSAVNRKLVFDQDQKIPSIGRTYRQVAIDALRQHRSQGDFQWQRLKDSGKITYQLIKAKLKFPVTTADSFFDWIHPEATLQTVPHEAAVVTPSGLPGVKIAGNVRIGLVEKNNNVLFVALGALGCDFRVLGQDSIKKSDLSQFDTIILGQEAYASFSAPAEVHKRLLQFVKKGGNLVVFSQFVKGDALFPYAPYPFKLSVNPITDENAIVNILSAGNPLMSFPNKISLQDFTGWVQDRGFAFPAGYPAAYSELISCRTSKGDLIRGGYLVTHYGKGSYIYTAYSWYRQFRAFHLGAYKNLANMLAYPYAKRTFQDKAEDE
jgi:LmbE family N-acetylglucosaminyl deacetylase/beta-glucosidase-like glycosyl hydrolase